MTSKLQLSFATLFFLLASLALVFRPTASRADLLELVNGDHYSGTVIELTRTNLEFQSDIQGLVKIPRDKIAKITLREPVIKPIATLPPGSAPVTSAATNSPSGTNSAASANAVIQQMRRQGVDPNMMSQVQQQILGQSNPEATRMFNNMVSGLMSGSMNVEDIRAQARKAIQDIQAARKDAGSDAATTELLDSYLGILQKFVAETDTPTPVPSTPRLAPKPSSPDPASQ